jgi:hypothetical protein
VSEEQIKEAQPEAKPPTGAEIVGEPSLPPKDPIAERAERRKARKEEKDRKVVIQEALKKWAELPADATARDREAIERLWDIAGRFDPATGQTRGILVELAQARRNLSIQLAMAGSKASEQEPIYAQMEIICRKTNGAVDEYAALVSTLSAAIRSRWESNTTHKKVMAIADALPDLPDEE